MSGVAKLTTPVPMVISFKNSQQRFRLLTILFMLTFNGCTKNAGPPSVSEVSAARPNLIDRIAFIETYVNFEREYHVLEYDVFYQNNGGGLLPGPSYWDVRIVAIVPREDIDKWAINGKLDPDATTPDWVAKTAQSIDWTSVNEWYVDGNQAVGIDREHNVVAYRAFAR